MAKKKKASLEDMRSEAFRRQDNLASDIDELIDRVHPAHALARWKNEAVGVAKGFFVADDGSTHLPRIAAVAGGVIGVIGTAVAVVAVATHDGEAAKAAKQREAAAKEARKKVKKAAKKIDSAVRR